MWKILRWLFEDTDLVLLREINRKVGKIMANQQELADQIKTVTDRLNKIGTETTKLIQKIDELVAAAGNAQVTPELQAAVDALAAQAKVVDDLVPDEIAPPPIP